MAEQKSPEERMAAWWADWRKADYSWDGLTRKKWNGWSVTPDGAVVEAGGAPEGSRSATLQDYWRDEESNLVEGDGKRWTRVHCPLTWADGSPTPKSSWSESQEAEFDALLSVRLGTAGDTKFDRKPYSWELIGADRRAQFQGAVLFGRPARQESSKSPLSVRFDAAAFTRSVNFETAAFSGLAEFSGAAFAGYANFERAALSGRAKFTDAVFSGVADFESASFSEYASFTGVVFAKSAYFRRAAFSADAAFADAIFFGRALFRGVAFGGEANFGNSAFSGEALFSDATFGGDAIFRNSTVAGEADFDEVKFSENLNFEKAVFSGDARFRNVSFSGDVTFDRAAFCYATFEGAAFSGDASFFSATFSGVAYFQDTTFFEDASFGYCAFLSQCWFKSCVAHKAFEIESGHSEKTMWLEKCTFRGPFKASYREFNGRVWFDESNFEGTIALTGAQFDRIASFERIVWPVQAANWHAAFHAAVFRGPAVFTDAGFKAFAAFDGATLLSGVRLDDAGEDLAKRTFARERGQAIAAAKPDGDKWSSEEKERREKADKENAKPITRREIAERRASARETRLKELERGCRVLKRAMEYSSNKTREQMFYRFELLARRAQKDTPGWEKFFSDLYWLSSDYGGSMARPFVALAVLIVLFAGAYFGIGYALAVSNDTLANQAWQALDLSWINVFKPLSVLSGADMGKGTVGALLLERSGPIAFGLRALATLQSLLAIVLAFLFALAVRRRFQIS